MGSIYTTYNFNTCKSRAGDKVMRTTCMLSGCVGLVKPYVLYEHVTVVQCFCSAPYSTCLSVVHDGDSVPMRTLHMLTVITHEAQLPVMLKGVSKIRVSVHGNAEDYHLTRARITCLETKWGPTWFLNMLFVSIFSILTTCTVVTGIGGGEFS